MRSIELTADQLANIKSEMGASVKLYNEALDIMQKSPDNIVAVDAWLIRKHQIVGLERGLYCMGVFLDIQYDMHNRSRKIISWEIV